MKKYQIPTLNRQTPQAEQSKIVTAVKGVPGVAKAVLNLDAHEIEITGSDKANPSRADIESAVAKAGFPLATK